MISHSENNDIEPNEDIIELYDSNGYRYITTKKISEGGQGAVYLTNDHHIAIKLAFGDNKNILTEDNISQEIILKRNEEFFRIIKLPLPLNTNITLPLTTLKNAVGYTMRLMDDMTSFEKKFSINYGSQSRTGYSNEWLESTFEDQPEGKAKLSDYIGEGGVRSRLYAYYKCACILAKIHAQGLVYCDFSDNNVFISKENDSFENNHVWLIDADNLNYQNYTLNTGYFTPKYGAPEIQKGWGCSFCSDCYAFATSLFWCITMNHPLQGKAYHMFDGDGNEADEAVISGTLPYVLDENEDNEMDEFSELFANQALSDNLKVLLKRNFTEGKSDIRKRPSMMEWAYNLSESLDNKLVCKNCGMAYQNDEDISVCPWCDNINNVIHITGYDSNDRRTGKYTREFFVDETIVIPERILNGADINNPDTQLLSITISEDKCKVKMLNESFAVYNKGKRIYGSYEADRGNMELIVEEIKRNNNYRMEVEIL